MMNELLDEEVGRLTEPDPPNRVLAAEIFRTPIGALPMARPVSMPESTSVGEAVAVMKVERTTFILLTDVAGRLSGIFTARDALLRLGSVAVDAETAPISRYMTREPDALQPAHAIAYALNFMQLGGHRHVPIVDAEGRPVGLIGTREIVAWLSEYFREEVLNLPPNPSHPEALAAEGG